MNPCRSEIVKFREMLEERLASKQPPLTTVPDEYRPVIVKLVHERYALTIQPGPSARSDRVTHSDKTLQALCKHVQQELSPAVDEDEEEDSTIPAVLPLETVESAIQTVARRVNYGLDAPEAGGKVPAAWLLWRWEVTDQYREWLPKAAKEKVDNRLRERQQVSTRSLQYKIFSGRLCVTRPRTMSRPYSTRCLKANVRLSWGARTTPKHQGTMER